MVSENQIRAIRKWDRANMRTVACRLRTKEAQNFKDYCAGIGSNPAAELKKYVNSCLEEYHGRK